MTVMKYIIPYIFALLAIFGNAQAATILEIQSGVSVYANAVSGSSGNYYDQTFTGPDDFDSPISATALENNVTGSNLTNYAWTPDAHLPDGPPNAYIDLSFGDNIYNGAGVDLVLFFAGTGTLFKDGHTERFLFSLDVGADGINEGGLFGVTASTTSDIYSNKFFASYAMIDLDDFGFDQATPLGDIRVYLGDSSMPALSALGAYHTTAVIPLPVSAVLFSSGLAVLSLFRRKKRL